MTLKEKFKKIKYLWRQAAECELIADEFAIGFAKWNRTNQHIFELSNHSYKELLEIYKKEKGL